MVAIRPKRFDASQREAGVSVVEVVLLAPLVVGFILVLVTFGLLVNAHGTVQGAARDAARSGSLQRDDADANKAAAAAAQADLGGLCAGGPVVQQVDPNTKAGTNAFGPTDLYTIEVSCDIPLTGVDWLNLGTQTIRSYSTAPLDTYRRAG